VKKSFKAYVTLLFQDLCTKESGMTKPYIRFYTFLKVGFIYLVIDTNFSL